MKIAHVTATFLPYYSGTGSVCYHNALELARRGHDVHVFTGSVGSAKDDLYESIKIHRLSPFLRVGNAVVLPQLGRSLEGFDLIHLHYPFFGGEAAAFAAERTSTPLVITYHNDVFLKGAFGLVEKILRNTLERYVLRSASRILFTSQDYAQASCIRPLLKGCEDRIGELPNGVDTFKFTPGRTPLILASSYNLLPGDRVALLIAGLDKPHYFKGVNIFLKAFSQLPENIKGVIVGDGDLRPTYTKTARLLGMEKRIHFVGRVSDQDLPDYYRLADVTVLPSITMGEAFGLVLIESLACGTPVIASKLPGVRTVVADGQDGFLVQPGDADDLAEKMISLLSDPRQGVEMGRYGRKKVEEYYSWPKVTEQLVSYYESLITSVNSGNKKALL